MLAIVGIIQTVPSLALLGLLAAGCTSAAAVQPDGSVVHIGVVLPLSGMPAQLAGQERLGIQLAADLANAEGGVRGRQIVLDVRDVSDAGQAGAVTSFPQVCA